MDSILTASYKKSQAAKMSTDTWLQLNRSLVSLILDPSALASVSSCGGKYATVISDLNKLVSVGTIGTHVFGHAIAAVIVGQVRSRIHKHIAALLSVPQLNGDAVSKAKAAADADIRAIDNIHLLPHKRQIEGSYRGIQIMTTVKNIQDEINWRIGLAWKGLAVQTNILKKLWCEAKPCGNPFGCHARCPFLGIGEGRSEGRPSGGLDGGVAGGGAVKQRHGRCAMRHRHRPVGRWFWRMAQRPIRRRGCIEQCRIVHATSPITAHERL